MKPRKIKENIYSVGAVDWNRRRFDSLIPLPDGIREKHARLDAAVT